MHVRFSFDRESLQRMQQAVAVAAQQQLEPQACWLPPAGALPAGGGDGGGHPPALDRLCKLQPEADLVAATAASLRELGAQQLNAEQRNAVAAVLCGAGRAFPYVRGEREVLLCLHPAGATMFRCSFGKFDWHFSPALSMQALFGPPGTGKSVSLVECALQLLAAHPSARLLLCAPLVRALPAEMGTRGRGRVPAAVSRPPCASC